MFGIITYDCPHKKTAEIIYRCHQKIEFILTVPFKKLKKRDIIIQHRPFQFLGPTPNDIGNTFSIEVVPIDSFTFQKNKKISELVIGGAGLLSKSILSNFKVINCHSGLIPTTRGLDSFKWAIYFQELMGITIHRIDENIDLGSPIHHSLTVCREEDDIKKLAERHYANEIDSLCQYIMGSLKTKKIYNLPNNVARRRMNIEKENLTIKKFNIYKKWALDKQKVFNK